MILDVQIDAGKIKRFHTVPLIGEQTVAEHSYNVLQILRHITDDTLSTNLMKAALDHDVLEYFTGDVPHTTKHSYPEFRSLLKEIEAELEQELNLNYELTKREQRLLRWADVYEAGLFGLHQCKLGNTYGEKILGTVLLYFTKQHDLPDALCDLIDELAEEQWLLTKNK